MSESGYDAKVNWSRAVLSNRVTVDRGEPDEGYRPDDLFGVEFFFRCFALMETELIWCRLSVVS